MANLYRFENHLRCVWVIQNYKFKMLRRPRYTMRPGGGTPIMIFRQFVYFARKMLLLAVHSKLDYPFSVKKDILSPHFIRKKPPFCLNRLPFPRGLGGATRGSAVKPTKFIHLVKRDPVIYTLGSLWYMYMKIRKF